MMLELEAMGLDGVKTELSAQYVDHNLIQQDHKNPDDHLFLHSACRRFGNPMAEVGESADDTVVAPSRVLARHANDEGLSFGRDRTAVRIRATFGTVGFLGNQSAVPRHYCVRERDGGDLLKFLAAKPFADLSQSGALWIGKAQAPRKLRAQDAILGDQLFILQEQALSHQARYVSQQPHPFVVAHGERTSYAVSRRNGAMHFLAIRPRASAPAV